MGRMRPAKICYGMQVLIFLRSQRGRFFHQESHFMDNAPARKTPLHAIHRQLGARMIQFAGWDMPVQYAGILQEHAAVRSRAGIFDVSHMGELEIKGLGARETLQAVTCNDIDRLAISQCQYSALTTPQGTLVDDLLIYRMGQDHFLLCVNAANQEKDYQWIRENAAAHTEVLFRSDAYAQIAVQGPQSLKILQPLTDLNLSAMRYYWFGCGAFCGFQVILSRTGYTGEDGFEIYCNPEHAETVWARILEAGRADGLEPAGLAARNTLRLEAGLMLYGHDMDETTTVYEADLGWICRIEKGAFIGREALIRQRAAGLRRILVGFEMMDRGIARDGYPAVLNGQRIGSVTSGSPAPFLGKNIGLAYLPVEYRRAGTQFGIIIREKEAKAQVVPTPFYRRTRAQGGS